MAPRRPSRLIGYVLLGLLAIGHPPTARAEDRIGELTAVLADGHTEKDRIAAVSSLARIEDKAALRALVVALSDPSPTVRGIAAAGLGKLRHKAAAPALRQTAAEDADPSVRQQAATALALVNKANGLPPEKVVVTAATTPRGKAAAAQAKIYVRIRSTNDDSAAKRDSKARKAHEEALRQTLAGEIADASLLTDDAAEAKKRSLAACQIDISIVRLDTRTHGGMIEVEAQLRLTVSDPHGKMLSFLSGGATMQVKRKGYNLAYLPQLQRDTLVNAVRGLSTKLVDHLRRTLLTT